MTTEGALAAIQKIQEAWDVLTQSMLDVAQVFSDLFRDLYESGEAGYGQAGMSPKQYGMTLQKRSQRRFQGHHFMRSAPRNRPYQRRVF